MRKQQVNHTTGEPRPAGYDDCDAAPYPHTGRAAELAHTRGVGGGGQRYRGPTPDQGTDGLWRFSRRGPTRGGLDDCAVALDVWRICGRCAAVYFDHRDHGSGDQKPALRRSGARIYALAQRGLLDYGDLWRYSGVSSSSVSIPPLTQFLARIFFPSMVVYVFLFFGESFSMYLYYYGWEALKGTSRRFGTVLGTAVLTLLVLYPAVLLLSHSATSLAPASGFPLSYGLTAVLFIALLVYGAACADHDFPA